MRYRDAKKLHNGDEVVVKAGNRTLRVVSIEDVPDAGAVMVLCDDGNEYPHRDIR